MDGDHIQPPERRWQPRSAGPERVQLLSVRSKPHVHKSYREDLPGRPSQGQRPFREEPLECVTVNTKLGLGSTVAEGHPKDPSSRCRDPTEEE